MFADLWDHINPQVLLGIAAGFALLSLALMLLTYIKLYQKKKRYYIEQSISAQLDDWISEAIVIDPDSYTHTYITPELIEYFQYTENRQFAIDKLIVTNHNLKGAGAENVIRLYTQLDFQEDSMAKLHSHLWHVKAQGIYELHMMEQQSCKDQIYACTNDSNEHVRIEAQTAMVSFEGFKGLQFLDKLTYPLSEWQQMKLIEQLHTMDVEEMTGLPSWLSSNNLTVKRFALKLTDIFLQFPMHDTVLTSLRDTDPGIQWQAIKTLGRIANERTLGLLMDNYAVQFTNNQQEIVKQMGLMGDPDALPFLYKQLPLEEEYQLKLECIRSIVKIEGEVTDAILQSDNSALVVSLLSQVSYELEHHYL